MGQKYMNVKYVSAIILAYTFYIWRLIPFKYFLTPYIVFCFLAFIFCSLYEIRWIRNLTPLAILKEVTPMITIKNVASLYQSRV